MKLAKAEDDGEEEGLTEEEIAALVAKLKLNDLGVMKGVVNPLQEVAEDSGESALLSLEVPKATDWFGQVNEAAADFAESRSGELISQIDEATRNMVRDIISSGLADGESRNDILDSLIDSRAFSEARAELIADTEIRIANGQGRLEGYKAAASNGIKLKKFWVLGANSCEECIENEEAGPIDLEDEFPGTETDMDPGHPNCDCGTSTEIEEEDEEDSSEDNES